ncbi:MAG TPA: glycerol kinase GlpK [Burkholderiales bacterium]|nr:glycerol kinase GlpK [Burkholderiales bacterium]
MSFILALDQGTTSSRAIVFDHTGSIRAQAQHELTQHYPKPGWVEQNPNEIWSTQLAVARLALQRAGVPASDIAALGITNQRETTVVWERKSGEPLCNAIVWQDRRTATDCELLQNKGFSSLVSVNTGLLLDPYFSGTKLRWILDHVSGARKAAESGSLAFGTVDSWLIWKLTGGAAHITDASNASRTLLYNIHTGNWDEKLLAMLDVPHAVLPAVCPSSGVIAETKADVLGARIPIAGIAGDQQAALFGQCCFRPGMVKNTYGTGCFMLLHTGHKLVKSHNRLLTTVAWRFGKRLEYALEGSVFVAGAVVQWLREGLGIIRSSREAETLAAKVPDNGGVYLVPAFTGLGSPHWDAYARGAILGLTRGTNAAHIARAALESIAFQSSDLLDSMRADSRTGLSELRVDGGATQNNLLMQFQADLLGVPVVRPKIFETTALGAAYLAGLAVGYWKNRKEIAAQWRAERKFEPKMNRAEARQMQAKWQKAVHRAKGWARK